MAVSAQLVCNAQHCPGSQAELSISGISGMKAALNGVLNADRRGWVRIMKSTIGKNAYY